MKNALLELLHDFNHNKIKYVILRGYNPEDYFLNDWEVDIYIDKIEKDKVIYLLKKYNWKSLKYPNTLYPHQQFFNTYGNKSYKIDIIWEFIFLNNKIKYDFSVKDFLDNVIMYNGIKIFNPQLSSILLLMHITFDKKYISNHNKRFLKYLLNSNLNTNLDSRKNQKVYNDLLCYMDKLLIAGKKESNDILYNLRKYFLNCDNVNILKGATVKKLQYLFCKVLNIFYKLFHNNIYCCMGMDGSGKSTVIKNVEKDLSELISIQYMGKKEFIIPKLDTMLNIKVLKPLCKVLLLIDFWFRLLKCKFILRKEIILCDRYPWDNYIFSNKKMHRINYFLYNVLFPPPKKIFYCCCSTDTSIKRKNDIHDIHTFKSMKNKIDNEIKSMKNVIILDSDLLSIADSVNIVENTIINDSNNFR